MTTYFQPMATGYFKVYSTRWDKFWCCTGSGMENFTKLGDTIYMHEGNTLYINLYQSSTLDWADQNVTIVQDSNIPLSDTATFTVQGSGSLDFRFRIPDWTAGTGHRRFQKRRCRFCQDPVRGQGISPAG